MSMNFLRARTAADVAAVAVVQVGFIPRDSVVLLPFQMVNDDNKMVWTVRGAARADGDSWLFQVDQLADFVRAVDGQEVAVLTFDLDADGLLLGTGSKPHEVRVKHSGPLAEYENALHEITELEKYANGK